jgi:hypothetical protein
VLVLADGLTVVDVLEPCRGNRSPGRIEELGVDRLAEGRGARDRAGRHLVEGRGRHATAAAAGGDVPSGQRLGARGHRRHWRSRVGVRVEDVEQVEERPVLPVDVVAQVAHRVELRLREVLRLRVRLGDGRRLDQADEDGHRRHHHDREQRQSHDDLDEREALVVASLPAVPAPPEEITSRHGRSVLPRAPCRSGCALCWTR